MNVDLNEIFALDSDVMTRLYLLMILLLAGSAAANAQCQPGPVKDLSTGTVVTVSSVDQLQNAVANLASGTTIRVMPGQYRLTTTLYVKTSNVVITGDPANCAAVELIGRGMDNANFGAVGSGIWINSNNVTVANLTIRDVYYHSIELNGGPDDIRVYNVRMIDAGEQFFKSSSNGGFGLGGDRGRVEFSVMEYLNGPPVTDHGGGIGYTNGVDVHGGADWQIRNNLFKNFHTPDTADHLFSPAILMWNGSSNTLSENNTFINVDRAIAYGLLDRANDHSGGVIKNNFIYLAPNLYSENRKNNSDAPIIAWSSPNTKIFHNTIKTNNNTLKSIELRFTSPNVEVINNLVDAPIVYREGNEYTSRGNGTIQSGAFVNESVGDLHLAKSKAASYRTGKRLPEVSTDIDGQARGASVVYIGADSVASGTVKQFGIAPILLLLDKD